MDLAKLIEPYSERNEDGKPLRTVEGQIKWLLGKNIPRDHIDKAVLRVYDAMEKGKTYENGHELDQALLEAAKESHELDLADSVRKLQDFFNGLKLPDAGRWKYLKAFFTGKLS
jgi:hypothetical protein